MYAVCICHIYLVLSSNPSLAGLMIDKDGKALHHMKNRGGGVECCRGDREEEQAKIAI